MRLHQTTIRNARLSLQAVNVLCVIAQQDSLVVQQLNEVVSVGRYVLLGEQFLRLTEANGATITKE